jgi:hypothetical protein
MNYTLKVCSEREVLCFSLHVTTLEYRTNGQLNMQNTRYWSTEGSWILCFMQKKLILGYSKGRYYGHFPEQLYSVAKPDYPKAVPAGRRTTVPTVELPKRLLI